jgi:hypothetical protein
MKKRSMFGVIGGAALLAAAPFSLHWSHEKNVTLSLDSADARIGRPGTALSVAGVHRRAYRRAARSTIYPGAAGAVGYGLGAYSGGYGYPAYSAPSAPYYGTGYGYGSYYGGSSYPAYSYPSYGYPGYGYGNYYRPGYRAARRVPIHRARWH